MMYPFLTLDDIQAQAEALRIAMDKAGACLTDEQAAEAKELYPLWAADTAYVVGDKRRSADKLWKCLQAHTSQAEWEPENAPALWAEIAPAGEYREIKDNMLPTEAFALDEIGWYGEKTNLYKSKMAGNTYTPVTYPDGWEAVT